MTERRSRIDPELIQRAREKKLGALIGKHTKLVRQGGDLVGLCPFHQEKTPSFNVVEDKGFYHCFGCGAHGDAIAFLMAIFGMSFREAVAELVGGGVDGKALAPPDPEREAAARRRREARERKDLSDRDRALDIFWERSKPGQGTPGELYLGRRGLRLPRWPWTLRYADHLLHPTSRPAEGYYVFLPALVAAVHDPAGEIAGIHRIFLDPDSVRRGAPVKTALKPAKARLARVPGGAVRLAPLSARIDAAEGIESACAVLQRHPGLTMWAAISTGGLRALELPPGTMEFVCWGDRDAPDLRPELEFARADGTVVRRPNPNYGKRPGEEAATARVARARAAGIRATRLFPGLGDATDFLDAFGGRAA